MVCMMLHHNSNPKSQIRKEIEKKNENKKEY